nr:NAD(P)-dependent oxidoreductase [Gammaproteobacteria bacterium]
MKILVTGATGFLGRYVVERLCRIKTQHEIIATGRDISKSYELTQLGAKFVRLDLSQDKNFNKLIEITENCDCVIHCAAFSSNWGGYE